MRLRRGRLRAKRTAAPAWSPRRRSAMLGDRAGASYMVPRYRAPDGTVWFHVLHGHVPDHEIDFMYCPEVPQGLLTRTHLGHLSRLIRYIEPGAGCPYAFAIGNLSRDDT